MNRIASLNGRQRQQQDNRSLPSCCLLVRPRQHQQQLQIEFRQAKPFANKLQQTHTDTFSSSYIIRNLSGLAPSPRSRLPNKPGSWSGRCDRKDRQDTFAAHTLSILHNQRIISASVATQDTPNNEQARGQAPSLLNTDTNQSENRRRGDRDRESRRLLFS